MHKFLVKRPRTETGKDVGSSTNMPYASPCPLNIVLSADSDDIISDPGLRKPIEDFDDKIRDCIRREYISKGPCQPYGHDFPKKQYGKSTRAFRDVWFLKFSWLEYSVSKDSAFCFYCFLFKSKKPTRFGGDAFVRTGFGNWKKAIERFNEHVGGVAHKEARMQLESFKTQIPGVPRLLEVQTPCMPRLFEVQNHSVPRQFEVQNQGKEEPEDFDQACLKTVLDVTRILLRQGLPFHGLSESSSFGSLNKGNFVEILEWYSARNPEILKVINQNASGSNQVTSPSIQKQMANACAAETTLAIVRDIGDNFFTLLVGESCDNPQQIAVVLRFVNKRGEVIERLLAFIDVEETSAICLKAKVDSLFAEHGLSLSRIRGQGYDGASNMRSELRGLMSLVMKENSSSKYVHCFSQQLQLVVVAVAESHHAISDFFSVVSMIVNTSGSSCKGADKLRQIEHDRIVQGLESGDIFSGRSKNQETSSATSGGTRWGSHYVTLIRLQAAWSSVLEVLQNVKETRGIVKTLIMRMETYDFVFILHLMKLVLGITVELSIALLQRDQNIVQALHLVETVKSRLLDFRENGWEKLIQEVEMFCITNTVPVLNMEDFIQSWVRLKRDGQVVTNYHYYRVEIFCEVIDLIAQEMENRFPETNNELLSCIACLDPRDSFSKFNRDKLVRLAELYPDDFSLIGRMMLSDQLDNYIYDMRLDVEFSTIQDLETLSKKMVASGKAKVYSMVYHLIELALVLPVATASVERAFSAMDILKTDLRNKLRDEWLNDSLVTYIENDVFAAIDNETILQRFQNSQTSSTSAPLSSGSHSTSSVVHLM